MSASMSMSAFFNLSSDYRYWALSLQERVLYLTFNRVDASLNSLNALAFTELNRILDEILLVFFQERGSFAPSSQQLCQKLCCIALRSGKENGFIAGADVTEFPELKTKRTAYRFMRKGQKTLNRLTNFPIPTLALVDGFCLGGGAELAMACHYRIASESKKTRIGFPEITLCLHPGFGGTVMLPNRVGFIHAFKLLLHGNSMTADQACALGLVDQVIPKKDFDTCVKQYVHSSSIMPSRSKLHLMHDRRLWRYCIVGYLLLRHIKFFAKEKRHILLPVLLNWKRHGVNPLQCKKALIAEARSIASLVVSAPSRQAVTGFLAR